MNVAKEKLETLIKDLPDSVDIEEVMYRILLLQKIEEGEAAIKEGKTLSHDEALNRLSKKWRN
jgi:predicted transcriptional regulator